MPRLADAKLAARRVVTEHAATFSAVPGVDRWRPDQTSPIENLFVAGDWTNTGWPATMEGAVRSGYLAAEALLDAGGGGRRSWCSPIWRDGYRFKCGSTSVHFASLSS